MTSQLRTLSSGNDVSIDDVAVKRKEQVRAASEQESVDWLRFGMTNTTRREWRHVRRKQEMNRNEIKDYSWRAHTGKVYYKAPGICTIFHSKYITNFKGKWIGKYRVLWQSIFANFGGSVGIFFCLTYGIPRAPNTVPINGTKRSSRRSLTPPLPGSATTTLRAGIGWPVTEFLFNLLPDMMIILSPDHSYKPQNNNNNNKIAIATNYPLIQYLNSKHFWKSD